MRVPRHLWTALGTLAAWVEPALVAEWARMMDRYAASSERQLAEQSRGGSPVQLPGRDQRQEGGMIRCRSGTAAGAGRWVRGTRDAGVQAADDDGAGEHAGGPGTAGTSFMPSWAVREPCSWWSQGRLAPGVKGPVDPHRCRAASLARSIGDDDRRQHEGAL